MPPPDARRILSERLRAQVQSDIDGDIFRALASVEMTTVEARARAPFGLLPGEIYAVSEPEFIGRLPTQPVFTLDEFNRTMRQIRDAPLRQTPMHLTQEVWDDIHHFAGGHAVELAQDAEGHMVLRDSWAAEPREEVFRSMRARLPVSPAITRILNGLTRAKISAPLSPSPMREPREPRTVWELLVEDD